jgi:ATP-dependent DNA helicase RecG
MNSDKEEIEKLMAQQEDEHLEFKEARSKFDFERLVKLCAAIANEGGGKIVLGVTDRKPRRIVGTRAFENIERTKAGVLERLRFRVEACEICCPDGRVLLFVIPPHPPGMPVAYKGAYWMRAGEELVTMTPDRLKQIFAETEPDFSAELCQDASLPELDPNAVEDYRARWIRKSGNDSLRHLSAEQLLQDAELFVGGRLTYAALILLGTRGCLNKHLPQAELVFEYRAGEAPGPAQQREEYRQGFFAFYDELWTNINHRNDIQHFRDGLFVLDIPTLNEAVVREAILNAVSH